MDSSSSDDDYDGAVDFLDTIAEKAELSHSQLVSRNDPPALEATVAIDETAQPTTPDWLLMLRRVFDTAKLSEVRLQLFIDKLGIATYPNGCPIVRQGESKF
jgi:hypothetical protein